MKYDAEGNRIRRIHRASDDYVEYDWDHRNRLTAVAFYDAQETLTRLVEYVYDVHDRRIAKRVDENGDSQFDRGERYVYDGAHVVLVFDDGGSLTNRFLYGPAVDQVFADEDALGEVLWLLSDQKFP